MPAYPFFECASIFFSELPSTVSTGRSHATIAAAVLITLCAIVALICVAGLIVRYRKGQREERVQKYRLTQHDENLTDTSHA